MSNFVSKLEKGKERKSVYKGEMMRDPGFLAGKVGNEEIKQMRAYEKFIE